MEIALFGGRGSGHNPFPPGQARPKHIRVVLRMFTVAGEVQPSPPPPPLNDVSRPPPKAKAKAKAVWWDETVLGTHLSATTLNPKVWDEWLPARLELWHPDMLLWRRRAADCGNPLALALVAGSLAGTAPTAATLADPMQSMDAVAMDAMGGVGKGVLLSELAVSSFWSALLPAWRKAAGNPEGAAHRWDAVLEYGPSAKVASEFDPDRMKEWEVMANRLSILLYERAIPAYRRGLSAPPSSSPSRHKGLTVPDNRSAASSKHFTKAQRRAAVRLTLLVCARVLSEGGWLRLCWIGNLGWY